MNPLSGESGHSLTVLAETRLPDTATQPGSGARQPGRHARPGRPDYRLRSLHNHSSKPVPIMSTRMDGQRPGRRTIPRIASTVVLLTVAALAALLLNGFVVRPYSVPGSAMTPTFKAGDRILVARPAILPSPIRIGEIVVFRPKQNLPCSVVGGQGGDLVRRVVALPGQTIWSVGNTIFVNGQPLRDLGWYDVRFGPLGSTPIASTKLSSGQYYVMADNRSDSCDSRAFGPISQSSIVGAGIAIVARSGHLFVRAL
jgi:signal peptidase I